jgi:hypothetical protein
MSGIEGAGDVSSNGRWGRRLDHRRSVDGARGVADVEGGDRVVVGGGGGPVGSCATRHMLGRSYFDLTNYKLFLGPWFGSATMYVCLSLPACCWHSIPVEDLARKLYCSSSPASYHRVSECRP